MIRLIYPRPDHSFADRDAVLAIVRDFGRNLERWFAGSKGVALDERAKRGLGLIMELWLKLAQYSLQPALQDAGLQSEAAVQVAQQHIDDLRRLAQEHAHNPMKLEAPIRRHLNRTETLLHSADAIARIDWPRLHQDLKAWIARWQQEIDTTGDIEDEDRDPVGEPPR